MAINVNSLYRSKLSPVYIETLLDGDVAASSLTELLPPQLGLRVQVRQIEPSESADSQPLVGLDSDHDLLPQSIKMIDNTTLLNQYLTKYQDLLSKSVFEFESVVEAYNEEERRICDTLQQYRKDFEEEFSLKSKLDTSIKDIEKRKDNLTFTKSKLASQLKASSTVRELKLQKITTLRATVAKLEDKRQQLSSKESEEKLQVDRQLQSLPARIEVLKQQNDSLEHELKEIGVEKKKLDRLLLNVKPLVEVLSSDSNFNRDGNLKPHSQQIINEVIQVMPDWKDEILDELDKTNMNETEWKHVFKSEIRKYLSIKRNLEIARANLDDTYQPQPLKSEYQVSLDFGGYSNALPKASHAKKSVKYGHGKAAGNWHNYYGLLYHDQEGTATGVASGSVDDLRSASPDDKVSPPAMESRIGSPFQGRVGHNSIEGLPLVQEPDAAAIPLLQPTSNEGYNYHYQPLAASHVWNSPLTNNNVSLNPHYVGLNALGYDSSLQLLATAASVTNGGGNAGISGFGDLFQTSLNHSSTSFHGETQLGAANPIRSTVFLQFKGLDLPKSTSPYLNYGSQSPVGGGLDGFILTPSPSGGSNAAASSLGLSESGNGVIPLNLDPQFAQTHVQLQLHDPQQLLQQPPLLNLQTPLDATTDSQIQLLSPQLAQIPLQHHNLWTPPPFSHTRNILNHSHSQIWRNDESSYGTALSDYNKRTVGQQLLLQLQLQLLHPPQ